MRILLNAINALSSGGRAVVSNMVPNIANVAPDMTFDIVLPAGQGYDHWRSTSNLNVHLMHRPLNQVLRRLSDIYLCTALWTRQFRSDICFTLGDIGPVRLPIPHVVLLQQAMLVYHDDAFEKLWSFSEKWKFKYTRWHFGRMAVNCKAITVQTEVMAKHLQNTYNVPLNKIWVIPSAIPADVKIRKCTVRPHPQMMRVNKPYRLLFLAAGYEHKNHIILPSLVRELQRRGLAKIIQIFVTLDPSKSSYEQNIVKILEPYSDCITNLTRIEPNQVSMCYAAASALFMPTLAESFGLIYLEAMISGCPILTSDKDYARWMCGDLALYFDPKDPIAVANTIENFLKNGVQKKYPKHALKRLSAFPSSWKIVAKQYVNMLRQLS